MKTALVTGATSFIGVNLIPLLLHSGYRVYGTIRQHTEKSSLLPADKNLRLIVAEFEELPQAVAAISENIDLVYHLAWRGSRGVERDDGTLQELNCRFSLSLLQMCLQVRCATFIDAGSQAEYGPHEEEITEESELHPATAYGYYKMQSYLEAQNVCAGHKVRYKHPRYFSLYGPGDYEGSLLMMLIQTVLAGGDIPLTECTQYWDFLHISDAAHGLLRLAENDCPDGAYNFASGDSRRLREYVDEAIAVIGLPAKPHYGEVPYPSSGPVSIKPQNRKLKAIGWKPEITFAEGVKGIVEAFRRR